MKFLNEAKEKITEFNYEDYDAVKIVKSEEDIRLILRKEWNENLPPVKLQDVSEVAAIEIEDTVIPASIKSQEIYIHKMDEVLVRDVSFSLKINYEEDFDE